jgi:GT2 family glycosyltransferase
MEKIYILLPVYNRREITKKYLNCLISQTYQNYHLILIDDGSNDGTENMVKTVIDDEKLTVIKGKGNWWWAGALQQGYLWLKLQNIVKNSVILIMNDDTEFNKNFLEIGSNLIAEKELTLIMAQCHQNNSNNIYKGTQIDWFKFKFYDKNNPEKVDCFCTSALFLTWESFEYIGGFYPRLLPHYISDFEFTLRAKNKGVKLITDPSLFIFWDNQETGYHGLNEFITGSFSQSMKKYFSKKSPHNPITFTLFIILACPWYWKFSTLILVWIKALCKIIYITFLNFKYKKNNLN